jgi:hypothetical protein
VYIRGCSVYSEEYRIFRFNEIVVSIRITHIMQLYSFAQSVLSRKPLLTIPNNFYSDISIICIIHSDTRAPRSGSNGCCYSLSII